MSCLPSDLNTLTIKRLIEELKARKLPYSFKHKSELVLRLKDALEKEKIIVANNIVDEVIKAAEDKSDTNMVDKQGKSVCNNLRLNEIEDALTKFDGENMNIEIWLNNFKTTAELCGWNEIQKFIYAKRLLKGAAKLAIEAEKGITNCFFERNIDQRIWQQGGGKCALDINENEKSNNESYLEYFYRMKKISSRGHVENIHLKEYIINGIPDTAVNKSILYQSTDLYQLKCLRKNEKKRTVQTA